MKKLLLLTLLTVTIIPVSARQSCVLDDANPTLSRLAEKVNADCSWTIAEVVKENILEQCRNADESVGVSFRNSSRDSLRFTIYSYTYDVENPYYYCKNQAGYKAYYSESVSYLREEERRNSRPTSSASSRPYRSSYAAEVKEEVKWKCIVPTYIAIPRTYTEQEKELLEFTYGGDYRFACSKMR